jgi:hypothetical protein
MDNVQKRNNCIHIPSSQSCRSDLERYCYTEMSDEIVYGVGRMNKKGRKKELHLLDVTTFLLLRIHNYDFLYRCFISYM